MNWAGAFEATIRLGIWASLWTLGLAASLACVAIVHTAITYRRRLRHPVKTLDQWWETASPERRIDFNFGNMFMLLGLIFPALSIVLTGPSPNSVLIVMPDWLQVWMCLSIFLGCSLKLHGALSGRKWWAPKTALARSYEYGVRGAPLASTGALVYGWYILSNTPNWPSALSGISTPMFGIGIALQAVLYWLEIRRIKHSEVKKTRELLQQKRDELQ